MPRGVFKRKPCNEKTLRRLRSYAKMRRKPNNCICLECGNGFKRKPIELRKGEGKFCSHRCKGISQKFTMIGSGNHQFGTHWQAGKNNPNWKGGKTGKNGYTWDWHSIKKRVKERDKYVCRICGIKNGEKYKRNNGVHHLDENKKNNSMKNLITICVGCHAKAHKPHLKSPIVGKRGGAKFSSN